MAVYVDQPNWKLGRMKMCHMLADNKSELLSMANKIGVNLKHIQYEDKPKEHFDICLSKRNLALKYGAKEVSSKELINLINLKK